MLRSLQQNADQGRSLLAGFPALEFDHWITWSTRSSAHGLSSRRRRTLKRPIDIQITETA